MGEIWVSDAGPGPSVEMLGRIGDRFERFAVSKGTSAGLGLSIVNAVGRGVWGEDAHWCRRWRVSRDNRASQSRGQALTLNPFSHAQALP